MLELKEYIVRCHSRFDSERPAVHCQFPVMALGLRFVELEVYRVMDEDHGVDSRDVVIDSINYYGISHYVEDGISEVGAE